MRPRGHRYFDFMYAEICVALGRRFSRYDLWLFVSEAGLDPSDLSRDAVEAFIEQSLDRLIATQNERLSPRAHRRLHKRLLDFDPRYPTPEEWLTGLDHRTV